MSSHMTEPVTSNGAATRQVMAVISDDYLAPASSRSVLAQVTGVLGMLAGLWVAISPWFLVLQHGGNNAAASNLIVGVAIVALGLFAVSGSRGFLGLEVGSLIAGVWLIISPWVVARHSDAGVVANQVVVGACIFLLGLAAGAMAVKSNRSRAAS